jgi:hypothetical protein
MCEQRWARERRAVDQEDTIASPADKGRDSSSGDACADDHDSELLVGHPRLPFPTGAHGDSRHTLRSHGITAPAARAGGLDEAYAQLRQCAAV